MEEQKKDQTNFPNYVQVFKLSSESLVHLNKKFRMFSTFNVRRAVHRRSYFHSLLEETRSQILL